MRISLFLIKDSCVSFDYLKAELKTLPHRFVEVLQLLDLILVDGEGVHVGDQQLLEELREGDRGRGVLGHVLVVLYKALGTQQPPVAAFRVAERRRRAAVALDGALQAVKDLLQVPEDGGDVLFVVLSAETFHNLN